MLDQASSGRLDEGRLDETEEPSRLRGLTSETPTRTPTRGPVAHTRRRKRAGLFFAEPEFYLAFRQSIVPWLRTFPSVKIWLASPSTGEDLYSLALLLEEEGLKNARIYVTQANASKLQALQKGIFPLTSIQNSKENHADAGGLSDLASHGAARGKKWEWDPHFRNSIVFFHHNLTTDSSFNEFQAVICREKLPAPDGSARQRILDLFDSSLCRFGALGIVKQKSLRDGVLEHQYREVARGIGLYRRVG